MSESKVGQLGTPVTLAFFSRKFLSINGTLQILLGYVKQSLFVMFKSCTMGAYSTLQSAADAVSCHVWFIDILAIKITVPKNSGLDRDTLYAEIQHYQWHPQT